MCEERDQNIITVPFTSRNKRIARVHHIENGSKVRIVIKGASELVIHACSEEVGEDG